jgi:hypothetical protein
MTDVHMTDVHSPMATTEVIPDMTHMRVASSTFVSFSSSDSLAAARKAIMAWCHQNNYHAVVGVRMSQSSGNLVYGTAIRWAPA